MTREQVDKLIADKATRHCKFCNTTKLVSEFYISYEKKPARWSIRHKCKKCSRETRDSDWHKEYNLRRRYNISREDYDNKLKEQRHSCAICKTHFKDKTRSLHVDHCHTTDKVRGLLCYKCNTAIGLLKENMDNVRNALKYLRKYKV